MDIERLEGHKRVLGILYIISAVLIAIGMLILNAFMGLIFSFAFQEMDPQEERIVEFVMSILQFLPVIVILLFSLPTLIAGIGLLTKQKWATLLALIIGCFKLFSFPIGTAIGIYAIWIYSEDAKISKAI